MAPLAFLDRFAGVRFYMPGDLWTSLPQDRKVVIPAQVNIRSESFVMGASLSAPSPLGGAERVVHAHGRWCGTHMHNMWFAFSPEKYAQKYPEIYPIINGQRYIPKDRQDQAWNPCFTSPQTLQAAEESALEYFRLNPDHLWFSLGLQDSHAHCECDGCKAAFARYEKECLDTLKAGNPLGLTSTYTATPEDSKDDVGQHQPPEKWMRPYALSQLQWRLLSQLAARLEQKLPGKYVEALAYGVTSFPPTEKMHPNVMVYTQIHVSDDVRGLMVPRRDGSLPI